MNEGEFKKRLEELWRDRKYQFNLMTIEPIVSMAKREYPQTKQVEIPIDQYGDYDFEAICKLLEQKIIEFENFGKKWFGDEK